MESSSKDGTRWKRARRIGLGLIGAALLAGVLWLAAARWNGVPADPADAPFHELLSRIAIDPALDRSGELSAALAALPPESAWTLPPAPPGMRWVRTSGHLTEFDLQYRVLAGDWSSETRPLLRAVIDFFQRQPVQDALGRLAEIEPGVCRIPYRMRNDLGRAGALLAARARYQQAERTDVDAAINDLLAILRLSATCNIPASYPAGGSANRFEALAVRQMQYLAFETQLTRQQARRITRALQTLLPDDREWWQRHVDVEIDRLTRALDAAYTRDEDGNGWLVLSRLDIGPSGPQPSGEARCGAWNVLSPFFNDRRTIASKIEEVRRTLEGISPLPFNEGWPRTRALRDYVPFNLLDWPLAGASRVQAMRERYDYIVSTEAMRRATIIAVALSAYRGEHGEYPSTLQELLGDYLDAIPLDPYDGRPIRYLHKPGEDDFLLYCVWIDQSDEGGKPDRRSWGPSNEPHGDLLFTRTRLPAMPSEETHLEKINP